MNRIDELFNRKQKEILNIYYTAGHPHLDSTVEIACCLERAGVDIIELGIPYSDPLADGETIQDSSSRALKNGMTLSLLFDQIKEIRKHVQIPIILMGYYNQMIQYGESTFVNDAKESGVDGFIIPDLPLEIFQNDYQNLFNKSDMRINFLITPQTSDERIIKAASLSNGFLYVVSQSSITGKSSSFSEDQFSYFKKIAGLNIECPKLIGFGIHDHQSFQTACQFANGAIIGSAFIRAIDQSNSLEDTIFNFVSKVLSNS